MNVNSRDYAAHIMAKMRDWENISTQGLDKTTRARARKNLLYLIRKYPQLAKRAGIRA